MPTLTMKEHSGPSQSPTETKLEDQVRCRAHEPYEARGHEDGLRRRPPVEIEITRNATSGAAA